MGRYPLTTFIETLDDLPQIKYLRTEEYDGIRAMVYEGVGGNAVIIDITEMEEDIEDDVAKGHLTQLGVSYLIDALFPT